MTYSPLSEFRKRKYLTFFFGKRFLLPLVNLWDPNLPPQLKVDFGLRGSPFLIFIIQFSTQHIKRVSVLGTW